MIVRRRTKPAVTAARRYPRALVVSFVASLVGSLSPALAAPVGPAPSHLQLGGYVKDLVAVTRGDGYRRQGWTDRDALVDDYPRVRLKLQADPRPDLQATVHYELYGMWGDSVAIRRRAAGSPLVEQGGGAFGLAARPRFMDLTSTPVRERNLALSHGLDRLQFEWFGPTLSISVGRQAVSWGTGRFWNPTDLFSGFAPAEIDRDEKPGVDVVRATWTPTPDSSLDAVVEPLDRDRAWHANADDSSAAVRARGHLGEYEFSLLGGTVEGDRVVGGDWTGYLGDAGFRGEWSYTAVPEGDERDYFNGLLSWDYSFAVPGDPYVALEYYYNGLGAGDPRDYAARLAEPSVRRVFERGTAFNIGRHYLAAMLRLTPNALTTAQALTIWNVADGSALEYLVLTWSLTDNTVLLVGSQFGIGPSGTEFGGWSRAQLGTDFETPDLHFAYLKWYF